MKNIVLICEGVSCIRNTTPFQRSNYLCENYNVFIFSKNKICDEVKQKAKKVVYCPKFLFFDQILFPIWAVLNILWLGRDINIDVIHTTYNIPLIISGLILRKICFSKWIADFWDDPGLLIETTSERSNPLYRIKNLYLRALFPIAKRGLKNADMILIALVPKILDDYGIDEDKIVPITNGVDLSITRPIVNLPPKKDFTILYLGHLKRIRGLDTVISTAKYLKGQIPNFKISLVGFMNPEDDKWLSEALKSADLWDNINLVGEVPHDEALLQIAQSDVCLLPFPKKRELDYTYPIKVFEYMAMGKVTIATNLEGINQIIQNEENGLIVEPEDAKDMAEAILRIYRDKELRKKIEKNAIQSVKKYDWPKINRRVGKAIDNLIA